MHKTKFTAFLLAALIASAALLPAPVFAARSGEHAAAPGTAGFNDTAAPEHGPAMDYAAGHGYLYLYADNGMAYPDNPMTRGEWAYTFEKWVRYLQPALTGMGFAPAKRDVVFEDISGSPFYDSIAYLASVGLTEPDIYLFRPDDFVTRQEVCDYIARLLPELGAGPDYALDTEFILEIYRDRNDFLEWYEWQIAFMTEARLISYYVGKEQVYMPDDSEERMFMPGLPYTRGEMCEMLLAAELLIREKSRERKADGLGVSPDMELDRADVKNITPTSYHVEITVNDAARDINPHAIIAYTPEDNIVPEMEDILSGVYFNQSQRLTEMRRVFTGTDETTYSLTMRGKPGAKYNLFIILKDGMEYSNIVEYTVNLPDEEE